jgi:CsoR family transcriptional regulator, copper-sensing transcriptional repressor
MENDIERSNIIKRLNKVEGQIRGIKKMIESEEGCSNILIQIAAVRSAINKVGGMILENYAQSCISDATEKSGDKQAVTELIDTIVKFTKYYDIT